ncbi:hypothetical protein T492DRAFT_1123141 [Pavlovales sp. CCMP2436]|nr:hypothetical protein T492DRAFT_1123141 [Pavlovales sp. CCMP2436]
MTWALWLLFSAHACPRVRVLPLPPAQASVPPSRMYGPECDVSIRGRRRVELSQQPMWGQDVPQPCPTPTRMIALTYWLELRLHEYEQKQAEETASQPITHELVYLPVMVVGSANPANLSFVNPRVDHVPELREAARELGVKVASIEACGRRNRCSLSKSGCADMQTDVVLPYPSLLSIMYPRAANRSARVQSLPPPLFSVWRSAPRRYRVAFVGACHGMRSHKKGCTECATRCEDCRQALRRTDREGWGLCQRYITCTELAAARDIGAADVAPVPAAFSATSNPAPIMTAIGCKHAARLGINKFYVHAAEVAQTVAGSEFCVQPYGDSPTRNLEPVTIPRELSWRDFSIVVNGLETARGNGTLLGALRSLDAGRITRMRAALARRVRSAQYTAGSNYAKCGDDPDAVDLLLRVVERSAAGSCEVAELPLES